jgi:hypothetical protein
MHRGADRPDSKGFSQLRTCSQEARSAFPSPLLSGLDARAPSVCIKGNHAPEYRKENPMTTEVKNRAAYVALICVPAAEGQQPEWRKIGMAWPADKGKGYNIRLVSLPPSGETVYLRRPRGGDQTKNA